MKIIEKVTNKMVVDRNGFNYGMVELAELYDHLAEFEANKEKVGPAWVKRQIKIAMKMLEDSIKIGGGDTSFVSQLGDGIERIRVRNDFLYD